MITNKEVEEFIVKFPVYQYAFITPEEIDYSEKVRAFCKRDCKKYDTNWACPPAITKISKCRERCSEYSNVLFFSSVAMAENLTEAKRKELKNDHEELTKRIEDFLIREECQTYTLTSDTCTICSRCNFPHEFCRHSELMHPCIESHGIVISELATKCDMDYSMGDNLDIWFSIIYYKEAVKEASDE